MWESPPLYRLEQAIESPSNPIGMRMRAAYFLRQAYDNSVKNDMIDQDGKEDNGTSTNINSIQMRVIDTLGKGLMNRQHGSLMRHEFAYVMGQLRDYRCCSKLEEILSDNNDCVMVRHECAEALGAIGANRSIPVLKTAMETNLHTLEIHQTCEIAIAHMEWRLRQEEQQTNKSSSNHSLQPNENEEIMDEEPMACACMISPYSSIDPAPPHPKHLHLSTESIGKILSNPTLPLFERYRAMFSLRNRGGTEAVLELCHVLLTDDTSTLLRHEIAYVLGQMQDPASIDALGDCLRRKNINGSQQEHEMVRHEAAEALGAIDGGDRWMDCERILKEFLEDEDVVVRESCLVALDAADYWGHSADAGNVVNLEKEEKEGGFTNLSFGGQKAVTNGKTHQGTKDTILNHFNVQV